MPSDYHSRYEGPFNTLKNAYCSAMSSGSEADCKKTESTIETFAILKLYGVLPDSFVQEFCDDISQIQQQVFDQVPGPFTDSQCLVAKRMNDLFIMFGGR